MKRMVLPLLAALVLTGTVAGCGSTNGEDFAVDVSRPIQSVYAPLGNVSLPHEFTVLFPGLKVERERPSDKEVIYTIPGDGSNPARIALRFETGPDGKSTRVHASVDVPLTVVTIGGHPQMISEYKVQAELKAIINRLSSRAFEDSGEDAARARFAGLLGALAIATDPKALARIETMLKDPERFAAELEAFGGDFYDIASSADLPDRAEGSSARPDSDPDAALEQESYARDRARREEQSGFEAAGAAQDRASGDSIDAED